MKHQAGAPGVSRDEAASARGERRVISALLTLVGLAAVCWIAAWWRVAAAEDARGRASARAAVPPAPLPRSAERRRSLVRTLAPQRDPASAADAGSVMPAAPEPRAARPAPLAGLDQGHGSELWGRSDQPDRYEFEPRLSLDGGVLIEAPVEQASAPKAFH